MSDQNSCKSPADKGHPSHVAAARDRMLSGILPADNAVRSVIRSSWQRCLAEQVDPRLHPRPPLNPAELEQLWCANQEVMSASDIILDEAHQLLADSGTIMHIVAPTGVILRCDGDPSTLKQAQDIGLIPGANWQEELAGTNAIGTALSIRSSVQVHAHEHFCNKVCDWTCSATVIRDPFNKEIVGAVNISGLEYTRHDYCLALAISSAHRIEGQLAQFQLSRRDLLLGLTVEAFARASADAVLLFDLHGHLLRASARADQVLAIRGIEADLKPHDLLRNLSDSAEGLAAREEDAGGLLQRLEQSWIEPVQHEGQLIGYLAVVPSLFAVSRQKPEHHDKALPKTGFARIIGDSQAIRATIDQARRLAQAPIPILLQGETGVGKELFARAIHETGPTRDGAFVALNCGGLSRDLLAAELFGYVEGAFTGARRGGMMGKIEAANGGTLFLDEIGEMPLDLQPMFLRVLQESEICRVGETVPRKVNFRLVAATNREMTEEVAAGRFRMDLYYRVSSMGLEIPPLRERPEDIAVLAQHLVARLAEQQGGGSRGVSPELLQLLERHSWPGNIRELSNVMTAAFYLAEGPLLKPEDLPDSFITSRQPVPVARNTSPLQDAEREMIERAIRQQNGNLTQAARQLKIAKSTLYAKLKKYGMAR